MTARAPVGVSRRRLLRTAAGIGLVSAAGVGTATADGGDERWRTNVFNGVLSSPTVADGTVYVGDRRYVNALDAETGEIAWRFEAGSGVFSSPTVVDGTLYVGSNDDNLYALDAVDGGGIWEDGDEEWSFETGSNVESSPTVVDGTVFAGSHDGNVYAVDAVDGEEEWRFETEDAVRSSPAVVDGTLYVGSNDGRVYAVDAATGEREWRFETGDIARSSPTVVDGDVFVGSGREINASDTAVYALDAETGDERWSVETGAGVLSSPTVADDTVYVGSNDGIVYALAAETGDERWSFETHTADAYPVLDSIDGVMSSPTLLGDAVFVGTGSSTHGHDPRIYAIDAESGSERWNVAVGRMVKSSPTVVDGTLYVGSAGGDVYALDTGVDGAGTGTRVRLGTLGHTDDWAYADQTIDVERTDGEPGGEDEDEPEGEDESNGSGSADQTGVVEDDTMPGFGSGGALAALGGAGYLLRQRLSNGGGDE